MMEETSDNNGAGPPPQASPDNLGGESKAGSEDPSWAKQSLRRKCECELCKSGKATTHNDDSHDQSLDQTIPVAGIDLRFIGGTTKCARTMIRYFEKKFYGSKHLHGKKVVEVGSGTGLVGSCMALLGAEVTLTDQSYVMEVLGFNLEKIGEKAKEAKRNFKVNTKEHVWGTDTKSLTPCDIVIGSDLIFALEGIRPLVKSVTDMVRESQKIEGKKVEVYVAVIRRFKWEELYFKLMEENFDSEAVVKEGDIVVYRYTWHGKGGGVVSLEQKTESKTEPKEESSKTNEEKDGQAQN